jgi:hypothetical protein
MTKMWGRTPADREQADAWLPDVGQALIAVAGFLGVRLHDLALRSTITLGPVRLLLAVEGLLLLPFVVFTLFLRRPLPNALARSLTLALLAVLGCALIWSVFRFVEVLPTYTSGAAHWELDGGGPANREHSRHEAADHVFPQQLGGNRSGWAPNFIDYLFVAFLLFNRAQPCRHRSVTPPRQDADVAAGGHLPGRAGLIGRTRRHHPESGGATHHALT